MNPYRYLPLSRINILTFINVVVFFHDPIPKVSLQTFKLVPPLFGWRSIQNSLDSTSFGVNHLLLVRNSVLSGVCSSSARGQKGEFSDILQPASPYMEMFTHHPDLLEEKEVTQSLGEAGFEFLFPETKSLPSPTPPPSLPSIPLPLVLEAEKRMSQCRSPLALRSPPCNRTPGV